MEFCEDCSNMLYIEILEDDNKSKLIYYCKNCNRKYLDTKTIKDNCVFRLDYNHKQIKKEYLVNKYTHLDITLPRVNNIKCPNSKCPVSDNPEVVYLKYDEERMKYIYICCDCQKAGNDSYTWFLD